jgi:hypothetical protein
MKSPDLPSYGLFVRWGGLKLDLVGRGVILRWLAALTAIGSALGFKLLF